MNRGGAEKAQEAVEGAGAVRAPAARSSSVCISLWGEGTGCPWGSGGIG